MNTDYLMGPPERGPWVRVKGLEFDISIRVDDDDDKNILALALELCERRRYGKTITAPDTAPETP